MSTPITASAFYDCFESVFAAIRDDVPTLRRFAGQIPKWRYPLTTGSVSFAFVTSSRAASLWPQMPGEFRVVTTWRQDAGRVAGDAEVSLFQYTSERDIAEYARQQRCALDKFVQHPGNAARRELFLYATDPAWLPSATDEEWCYYFDASDVFAWAEWYRRVLPPWLDAFARAPESRIGWTRRVMQSRRSSPGDDQRVRRNSATLIAASSAIAPPRSSAPFTTGRSK